VVHDFPNKTFQGTVYTFSHLAPTWLTVPLNIKGSQVNVVVSVKVTYGCHCFTEEFDEYLHSDHHRYTYLNELRAFDTQRYTCSLQLPQIMLSILRGQIYLADRSYTYVAQINLPPASGFQKYSVFFSLNKKRDSKGPEVELYVKSAYLSALKPPPSKNARKWRFGALIGQISGVF
jgi:hypothetical protein